MRQGVFKTAKKERKTRVIHGITFPVWRAIKSNSACRISSLLYLREGRRATPANTVDHIEAFKGEWELFIDRKNHQSVCSTCHSRHKQIQEKGGILPGCDVNGFPIDGNHPWSQYEKAINEKKENDNARS